MRSTPLDKNSHNDQDNREVLVRVENVSKKFCRSLKKSLLYGVQDIASELVGRKYEHELRPDEFWSVNDVSFELRRGECLGLIGRNGAGKSTLLRMLNGLIKPDRGKIEINGQVGGLIALGAGFNPVLTGRENIYVNGSILGLSKADIDARFEEIVEFAEIGEFIDAPVQTYSSGMNVRLGFAVAAVLIQPDVLLLDEVLAVGDIGFTIKCLNRMRILATSTACIFVSHNMPMIANFCDQALVMSRGRVIEEPTSEIGEAINRYLSLFPREESIVARGEAKAEAVLHCPETDQWANHDLSFPFGSHLKLKVYIETNQPVEPNLILKTQGTVPLMCFQIENKKSDSFVLPKGKHELYLDLGKIDLNAGNYYLVISLVNPQSGEILFRHEGIATFRVHSEFVTWQHIVRQVHLEQLVNIN